MTEHVFLCELAEIILCNVNSEKYPLMENDIVKIAHFNRRIFSREKLFRTISRNLIRFLLNIAMAMDENDFKEMGYVVVDRIWEASDDGTGDSINTEHNQKRIRP